MSTIIPRWINRRAAVRVILALFVSQQLVFGLGLNTAKAQAAEEPTVTEYQFDGEGSAEGGVYYETDLSKQGKAVAEPAAQEASKQAQGEQIAQAGATTALTCTAGQILASALKGAISGLIQKVITGLFDQKVPTDDKVQNPPRNGVAITLFGVSIPLVPSWDSIAYCIINAIIRYIADSTIAWIRGGFNGSPAFVEDPGRIFQDIADYELGAFVSELTDGFLCRPFDVQIKLGLLQNQAGMYGGEMGYGRCSWSQQLGNMQQFVNGNFEQGGWAGWFQLTQRPENNPYMAKQLAQEEYQRRLYLRQNTLQLELNWGRGFLSFKDPETGKTTTPGQIIETAVAKRLGMSQDRLILAEKFDQLVDELVNALIKVALNEILETAAN